MEPDSSEFDKSALDKLAQRGLGARYLFPTLVSFSWTQKASLLIAQQPRQK
jgi:hypothetical protein